MFIFVSVCTCVQMCGCQVLILDVFLQHTPQEILRQGGLTTPAQHSKAHYACPGLQSSLHLPRVTELTTPAQRFSTLRGSNLQSLHLNSKSFTHFWNLLVVLMLYSFGVHHDNSKQSSCLCLSRLFPLYDCVSVFKCPFMQCWLD